MKGLLITFEGIDGVGKTTQIQMCADWLHTWNLSVVVTREPGGTDLGYKIRELFLDKSLPTCNKAELMLLMADRAQHIEEFIKPQLETGAIVLCDRFTDSTLAYQGSSQGVEQRFLQEYIRGLNHFVTEGLQPDLTIWLDADVELCEQRRQARGTNDRIEGNDREFHQRVRIGYAQLADAFPKRIRVINADDTPEEVHRSIRWVMYDLITKYVHDLHGGTKSC